jgi:hypothetical protein
LTTGLSLGIPQAFVLRRYAANAYLWILICVLACAIAFAVWGLPLLFHIRSSDTLAPFQLFISSIGFSLVTGIPLYTLLTHKPKPKHDARIEDAM